jgi:hypothetical protein
MFASRTGKPRILSYHEHSNGNPTSADIKRTIPGTPEIPDNINALITLLILNQIALVQVIGDKAPPATDIQRLVEALYDNYNCLTGITNFQGLISNKIVYQLCHHLERYFIVYCTEADVQGIENNNLSLSHSYRPIFTAKRTPPRVTTPEAGGGGGGGMRGGDGGATPAAQKRAATAAAKAAQPVVRTGPGCAAITKLVEDHRAKHDGKIPPSI